MAHGPVAPPNTYFATRKLLGEKVHRNREGGIGGSGIAGKGAESILLTGGYEDDVDNGDFILYTGHGGRDRKTGWQIADQEFTRLNKSLRENVSSREPVRVVRREGTGFRYAGLYSVDDAYDVLGVRGFRICRFELNAIDSASNPVSAPNPPPGKKGTAPRAKVAGERIIRDTAQALWVKSLYKYACQVCGSCLQTRKGGYAEGAHIVPLGRPHNGHDVVGNILCLCPNHHVLLDTGGLFVTAGLECRLADGTDLGALKVDPSHSLDLAYLAQHRAHFGF